VASHETGARDSSKRKCSCGKRTLEACWTLWGWFIHRPKNGCWPWFLKTETRAAQNNTAASFGCPLLTDHLKWIQFPDIHFNQCLVSKSGVTKWEVLSTNQPLKKMGHSKGWRSQAALWPACNTAHESITQHPSLCNSHPSGLRHLGWLTTTRLIAASASWHEAGAWGSVVGQAQLFTILQNYGRTVRENRRIVNSSN